MQPYRVGFDATGNIKRSDFGLYRDDLVRLCGGDDVQLMIEAEAIRR